MPSKFRFVPVGYTTPHSAIDQQHYQYSTIFLQMTCEKERPFRKESGIEGEGRWRRERREREMKGK